MFVWFRIYGLGTNAKDLIQNKAVSAKVLMLPGEAFIVDSSTPAVKDAMFVRASFSVATDEQIEEALKRFAALLKQEYAAANAK